MFLLLHIYNIVNCQKKIPPSSGPPWRHPPSEIVFQEQSYSSLHSGWSLACDYFHGDIDDPCGVIRFLRSYRRSLRRCWLLVVIPEAIGGRAVADAAILIVSRRTKHRKTWLNILKHG